MEPIVEVWPDTLPLDRLHGIFEGNPYAFLLESGGNQDALGRFSIMGGDPFLVFSSRGDRCAIRYAGGYNVFIEKNPFSCLGELLAGLSTLSRHEIPMVGGGAVGYLSYDMGRSLERLPRCIPDDTGIPECIMAFYDRGIVVDHHQHETYLFSTGQPFRDPPARLAHRDRRFRELQYRLKDTMRRQEAMPAVEIKGSGPCSNFSRKEYMDMVEKALGYIGRGEIYQVNLSQRFEARLESPPWALYRRLRSINPAPFASFLDFPEVNVVSSSPERFLKLDGLDLETRPIKGTRPRGKNVAEDLSLKRELLESEKDRAELAMIVDQERNDLCRVCRTGTVEVPSLATLEEYATVYHLVATVTGKIPQEKGIMEVLKGAFPGGSITGAPKIRSMEIIEELEPVRRGIYTGSIGYIDFAGKADLNIVIRTFVIKGQRAFFQVGGGIVADSSPEAEFLETLDKARALFAALGL
mgnify:CR=1 FL=1